MKTYQVDKDLETPYLRDKYIGNIFDSNNSGRFEVLGVFDKTWVKRFVVRFIETGYQTLATASRIRKGVIKDPYHPKICGVGYLGNGTIKGNRRLYSIWASMIHRCYDENSQGYKNYGGRGIKVCERWHNFGNFLDDYPNLKGYDPNKKQTIDKNSVIEGNKVYSPDNCQLISRKKNLQDTPTKQRQFKAISPDGEVYYAKNQRKFAREHTDMSHESVHRGLKEDKKYGGWEFEFVE